MSHPAVAFYSAGSNRTVWIVVVIVALLVGLGFLFGGFYLLFTDTKKVRRQEQLMR